MPLVLTFSLETKARVKTVVLVGSWDNYVGQLPLSRDKSKAGPGHWKGCFRFHALSPAQRAWYYYIVDGFHVTFNPAQPSITEPTTRRILNILSVPEEKATSKPSVPVCDKAPSTPSKRTARRESLNLALDIPKGRPLSLSMIQSPRPVTPRAAKFLLEVNYDAVTREAISSHLNTIDNHSYTSDSSTPSSLTSSLSYRSHSRSPGSVSSQSDCSSSRSVCSCCSDDYGEHEEDGLKLDYNGARRDYLGFSRLPGSPENAHHDGCRE
ncbi:GTP-binding protein EsdC [Blumeria hordei DH14]|uniref:GTP-binding protein EsdC n=1 Tax=Blumeria graminis f. sp. hordei (strain DH14) TaxID=546991 RepID=N1J7X7_BLUG1|nr:GTP-binding protein EsdC [Blumeria hordei DH14]